MVQFFKRVASRVASSVASSDVLLGLLLLLRGLLRSFLGGLLRRGLLGGGFHGLARCCFHGFLLLVVCRYCLVLRLLPGVASQNTATRSASASLRWNSKGSTRSPVHAEAETERCGFREPRFALLSSRRTGVISVSWRSRCAKAKPRELDCQSHFVIRVTSVASAGGARSGERACHRVGESRE